MCTPAASSAQATANIRSAIRHNTALDNLYCSAKSSSPRLLWPSFSSIERCATTRKACSTAILAATMAGNATAPPPNAITRIAAAMISQGNASRNRNGPNDTCGRDCWRNCLRSAIVIARPCQPNPETSVPAVDKIESKTIDGTGLSRSRGGLR